MPPQLPLRFFHWFCHPELRDSIEGDLMELYGERVKEQGKRKADLKFIRDVILLFRPAIIGFGPLKNKFFYKPMLKNYLLVAWRNALLHKGYTFINVTGLSVGVAVTVMLLLFVTHEMSYDDFHQNKDRVYRIQAEINYGEQTITTYSLSAAFGELLKESGTGIVDFVRLREPGRVVVQSNNDHKFFEDRFIFSDSSFFSVFSFRLLEGHRKSMAEPGKVFLTPAMAKKYFGEAPAVGKYITYQGITQLEVAGIVAPPPSNSSLQFDFVASFPTLGLLDEGEVSQYQATKAALGAYPTFLWLDEATEVDEVEKTIAVLAGSSDAHEKYHLQPLKKLPENVDQLIVFSSIALLVLILALVNYMNLTTARATTRAKEVGLRKVAGATRSAVASQFYVESAAITIFSFVIAYLIISITFPYIQHWLSIDISTAFLSSPQFLVMVVGLLFICVFLAGSYPALILSGFKPVSVLKGQQRSGLRGTWIRKGLTTFQFAVSMILIFASLIIQNQLTFLREREIGINKDQVLVVKTEMESSGTDFYNKVSSLSSVEQVGQATLSLFKGGMGGYFTKTPITKEEVFIKTILVDKSFFSTLDIPFQHQAPEGIRAGDVVVNQTGLEELKMTEQNMGVDLGLGNTSSKVMGVVKDFNFTSLKHKISGVLFFISETEKLAEKGSKSLYIRLNTDKLSETVHQIRTLYEEQKPVAPFEYYFLDDAFNELYREEEQMARLFQVFTALAIGVACLGLLGLVTFTTERKTREIGIRKVLGATESSIITLIAKEFSGAITLGCVLSAPIAWVMMHSWLESFPYRTTIGLSVFVVGILMITALALLTVGVQALSAARANPVVSLRSE